MKPYIIAETAYNHEGNSTELIEMIDDVSKLKLNAIKFHLMLDVDSYITKDHELNKKYKEWRLSKFNWRVIINHALNNNLDVVALCDDIDSLKFIKEEYGDNPYVSIELHPITIIDFNMLYELRSYKGKIILGIGGCTIEEIEKVINYVNSNKIILMYGFQVYPTDYSLINLSKIKHLKEIFKVPIGYADHTAFDDPNNVYISTLAASMGINILEKHYTMYEGQKRVDYQAAVGYTKMKQIKEKMEIALNVYGNDMIMMSNDEKEIYGKVGPMRKALVAKKNIKKGQTIYLNDLCYKRTSKVSNLNYDDIRKVVSSKAKKNIKKDKVIDYSDFEQDKVEYNYGVDD